MIKNNLDVFIERLKKRNINLELACNYPWIYIIKINDKKVVEKFYSKYCFTLGFMSIKPDVNDITFTDIKEIFKLIRKYK